MPAISRIELSRELAKTYSQVSAQIDVVKKKAEVQGMSPYLMVDEHGSYILAPLLVAKANLLHGLTLVNDRKAK